MIIKKYTNLERDAIVTRVREATGQYTRIMDEIKPRKIAVNTEVDELFRRRKELRQIAEEFLERVETKQDIAPCELCKERPRKAPDPKAVLISEKEPVEGPNKGKCGDTLEYDDFYFTYAHRVGKFDGRDTYVFCTREEWYLSKLKEIDGRLVGLRKAIQTMAELDLGICTKICVEDISFLSLLENAQRILRLLENGEVPGSAREEGVMQELELAERENYLELVATRVARGKSSVDNEISKKHDHLAKANEILSQASQNIAGWMEQMRSLITDV
ncbi:hypothetical protein HY990_01875 [Candidatus Micrarchaeota archaeon]|nr:hypothetical protein [Candidatus Micrarchaeota archaeon]